MKHKNYLIVMLTVFFWLLHYFIPVPINNNYALAPPSFLLTSLELAVIKETAEAFFRENRTLLEANKDEFLASLLDPQRLELDFKLNPEIMPLRKSNFPLYFDKISEFSLKTRQFITLLPRNIRVKIFSGKLFFTPESRRILRDFLSMVSEKKSFLKGILEQDQDIKLLDIKDYSSARSRYPGLIVYRITLQIGDRNLNLFIKGCSKDALQLLFNMNPFYEQFGYEFLSVLSLDSLQAKYYRLAEYAASDLAGFTLMEEISGVNFDFLVEDDSDIFPVIKDEHLGLYEELLKRLAFFTAAFDLLGKGDRTLAVNGDFPVNYIVSLVKEKFGLFAIDFGFCFNETNKFLEKDIREDGRGEIPFILMHPEALTSSDKYEELKGKFSKWYKDFSEKVIVKNKSRIIKRAAELFGQDSKQVKILKQRAEVLPDEYLKGHFASLEIFKKRLENKAVAMFKEGKALKGFPRDFRRLIFSLYLASA